MKMNLNNKLLFLEDLKKSIQEINFLINNTLRENEDFLVRIESNQNNLMIPLISIFLGFFTANFKNIIDNFKFLSFFLASLLYIFIIILHFINKIIFLNSTLLKSKMRKEKIVNNYVSILDNLIYIKKSIFELNNKKIKNEIFKEKINGSFNQEDKEIYDNSDFKQYLDFYYSIYKDFKIFILIFLSFLCLNLLYFFNLNTFDKVIKFIDLIGYFVNFFIILNFIYLVFLFIKKNNKSFITIKT